MHPELGWGLPSYGIMILAGFALGLLAFRRVLKLQGLDVEHGTDWILLVFLAALAGARLFHVLFSPESYRHSPWRIVALWDGGLSFQGGLSAGALATYLLRRRIPLRPFLDAGALGLALGHFWGRIGCLMAGCCWGKAHENWPGSVVLARDSAAGLHYQAHADLPPGRDLPPMIPVQAYEAAWLLMLFFTGLVLLRRRRLPAGGWFALYLAGYGFGRFFLEMLRGDPGRGFLFRIGGGFPVLSPETEGAVLLSVPQAVSLLMLVGGVWLYRKWVRAARNGASLDGPPAAG